MSTPACPLSPYYIMFAPSVERWVDTPTIFKLALSPAKCEILSVNIHERTLTFKCAQGGQVGRWPGFPITGQEGERETKIATSGHQHCDTLGSLTARIKWFVVGSSHLRRKFMRHFADAQFFPLSQVMLLKSHVQKEKTMAATRILPPTEISQSRIVNVKACSYMSRKC